MPEKRTRRRFKRGPNQSESTGKSGQELPQSGPAPLRPSYPEPIRPYPADEEAAEPAHAPEPRKAAVEPEKPGKIVVETQPENLGTPDAGEGVPQRISEPKGYVVLTIGLPGSGKTTWYKRRGVQPLSSDMLRTILFDDITDQRYSGLVFSTLRSLLRARLIAKMPWNYVDATNLSPHERRQWIKMARSFGYEVQAVFFDVPLELCLERNAARDRRVAEDVIQKMAERLKAPTFQEGFSKITVVRPKGSGAVPAIADTQNEAAESTED